MKLLSAQDAMEQTGLSYMQWRYWRDKAQVDEVMKIGNNKLYDQKGVDRIMRTFNNAKVI